CQVRNDRLAAVARVMTDQAVEHACHAAEIEERPGLMQIEMWRAQRYADAQHATTLRVRLRRRELKFRAVEFQRNISSIGEAPAQRMGARHAGGAGLQQIAASPCRVEPARQIHAFPPFWVFYGAKTPCLMSDATHVWDDKYHRKGMLFSNSAVVDE